jgi:hypothetical protein
MYLLGVSDSAHLSSHEKRSYPTLHIPENTWQILVRKLSNTSKQSKLMLTELRYQVKIHTISKRPRETKLSCKFSQFFYFFLKETNKQKQKLQYGNDIICTAKSNLTMPLQKNSRSTCFFCLPQISTYKVL